MTVSRFGFAFVGLMITATVCLAQPVQSRPGVAPEDDDPRRIVADPTVAVDQGGPWWLSLTVFQGYDGKGYSTDPNDANGGTLLTLYGPNTGGTIRGSVAKGGTRGGITADVGTSLIYYNNSHEVVQETTAMVSEWRKLGRNTSVSAAQSGMRTPYFNAGTFPGVGTYTGTDILRPYLSGGTSSGLQTSGAFRFNNDVRVDHVINQRTMISAGYKLATNGLSGVQANGLMHDVGGRLTREITRDFGYHLGYSYGNGKFGGVSPTTLHNLDVGLDVRKQLSLTRRTLLTFSTGTALIKAQPVNRTKSEGPLKQFTVLGHARLSHYFGRTWVAALTYDRGWQMYDGLLTPYFGNGVTAVVAGKLGRAVTVGGSTSYETGVPIGNASSRDHATVENAWIQYTLASRFQLYAQYGFYAQRFNFPPDITAVSLPGRLSRSTVRGGLTLILPRHRAARPVVAPQQPVR